ncbi:MAG: STAS domain-containing protein [Candidatus Omnitrophica bacterium]|nr:STAS domain-containing protein [Candidatus Omnitrophota bacterium]
MSEIGHKVEKKGNIYIFRMSGTINAQTLNQYREIIDDLMKEIDVSHQNDLKFIMDYSGIDDVDSSALANIVDRLKNDVRYDHKVMFINVPEKFKDLLEIFKLKDSIEVYDSQQEAEEALGA